jgi:hypothetical protein
MHFFNNHLHHNKLYLNQKRHPFHDRERITDFLNDHRKITSIRKGKEIEKVKSKNRIGRRNSNNKKRNHSNKEK